jgi:hypothetical protein
MIRKQIRNAIVVAACATGVTSTGCIDAVSEGLTDGLRASLSLVVATTVDTAMDRILEDTWLDNDPDEESE